MVVVAHRSEAGVIPHQTLEHFVLRGVGVLVFVDQHMGQLGLPFLAHIVVVLQKFERQTDQVVKVHALVSAQTLFVTRHDFGDGAFVVVFGDGQRLLGIEPHVFPQADRPLPLASRG